MNGAQSLIQTLVNGGIEVCFTNPGTSEMHFVASVDKVAGMRTVLGLFEGVCTGAADGYARMAGKPAATLLHLGPGLGNGLANLHNAKRANTPIVNIVGDHATFHVQYDAPLTSDIEAIAGAVSGWVRLSPDARSVARDGAAAIAAARQPPGQIATLILPADTAWNEGSEPLPAPALTAAAPVETGVINQIAKVLQSGEPTMILMTGPALMEPGLLLASRIAQATVARLMGNRANQRLQRGAGRPMLDRLPYVVPEALKAMSGIAHLILVGAKPPVSFFGYPNTPSWLTPEGCQIHTLASIEQDSLAALEALAETLHVPAESGPLYQLDRPALPTGSIDPDKVWAAVGALMPENTIISDEAVTSGRNSAVWTAGAPPHDWLNLTGGAIGDGMPMAIGAAVACPDRKVLSMQSDGSAMYTVQSLWTQARENLDIVTILFNNRAYRILQGELQRVGAEKPGPKATEMLDLGNPDLDWVKLAEGMGVQASRAETAEAFNDQLQAAIHNHGPHLIEVPF